jgi:single-strand DNA-binding protein
MSFEIEGKLHKKFDTEQKSGSFQTREFVLLDEKGQYANYIKFQLVQDRVEAIDSIDEGAMIKVYFDLRGREWQGKYFTNLQAWRIEAVGASQGAKAKAPAGDFPSSPPGYTDEGSSYDDLPF